MNYTISRVTTLTLLNNIAIWIDGSLIISDTEVDIALFANTTPMYVETHYMGLIQ